MNQLNLPSFSPHIRREGSRYTILDQLRRRYVSLTPEEWVRQHFVNYLIQEKGYPRTLLANEVELRVGDKKLRCDTLLYKKRSITKGIIRQPAAEAHPVASTQQANSSKKLYPLAIVEYKAPTVSLSQKVFDQIFAYNILLRVDFLIVSNGLQHYCCQMDYAQKTYHFLPTIPNYEELCRLTISNQPDIPDLT